ncbi:hypothetical protein FBEOM_1546 [Fusarium beomiforme]|uniref:ATP-dependent DNA ligase family profile domain-containing protein n=1 Tax=Fusarium beomiforme TaxID=44412 RepID=A0A9P5E4A1_9HYPO|nr:hypothetical protein FBEOM_1546 [Fusarium beomiforme]
MLGAKHRIFSKSGKDSTEDRVALHRIILESLKIGQADTRVKKACILEGELVVYDDSLKKILPFHKIRKHVSRRGRFLNTELDSLPGPQEHLMIIYYDIILLEHQSLINLRHSERFKILSGLICCRKGWAELVPRQVIDFGQPLGASTLRKIFATAILARKEGLVLKADEPYFDFKDCRRKFSSCCIKLKKEYIGNFGDVGDFSAVGARYDSTKALSYQIPGLKWTHFYIGCLDNKEAVRGWGTKPEFTIVNVVELNDTILREVITYSNPEPAPPEENRAFTLKLAPGIEQGSPPTVIFTKPLVFDLKCFSFDRVGNTGFWSLRFPSVTKVHFDRDFTDTISFEQLQALAREATTTTSKLEDSQENLQWVAKLEAADPHGIAVDAPAMAFYRPSCPPPSSRSLFDGGGNSSGADTEGLKFVINSYTSESELQTETKPDRLKPSPTRVTTVWEGGCVYASEDCMFANAVVLVSPGLLAKREEAKRLLAQHGVDNPVTDLNAWLKGEKEARQTGKTTTFSRAYVVCDSGDKPLYEHLDKTFSELRQDNLFNKGTQIEIHDWRFLPYLTTQENKSVEMKDFDGFSDWKIRWWLGTI